MKKITCRLCSHYCQINERKTGICGVNSNENGNLIATFLSNEFGTDTPWHISSYHPDYKMMETKKTPMEKLKIAYAIEKEHNIQNVYLGNI